MSENNKIIETGNNIEVHYKGSLEDGTQFDSSYDRNETLAFTVGAGQMIPGFDTGVIGMSLGEKKTLIIESKDAYGEFDKDKKQIITKKDLVSFMNAGFELVIGEKLPTQYGEFEIIDSDESNITIDLNHKLAGKKLIFDVEIVNIK